MGEALRTVNGLLLKSEVQRILHECPCFMEFIERVEEKR